MTTDTVGRARQKLTKAICLSSDGEGPESRREMRDAAQLLDAVLLELERDGDE
jgi:hypothetical protein